MRALRIILGLLLTILLLPVLVVGGLAVALNTSGGRDFAVREINHFAGPMVQVAGLGGHFPADIKLQDVQVADAKGVWLHATGLELRWLPQRLLQRDLNIAALTAAEVDVLREPVPGKESKGGGGSIPRFSMALGRLEIGTLTVAPDVTKGEAIALHIEGAAQWRGTNDASMQLLAVTPDGTGQYKLDAAVDAQNISMQLHISEPPGGIAGQYAGPQAQGKFVADVALTGPRKNAALEFTTSLGSAILHGAGHIGLEAPKQFADITLSVPELAPFGALAGKAIAGDTQLHFRVAQADKNAVAFGLDGYVALRQAPANLQKFLGPRDTIAAQAVLLDNEVTLDQLHLEGENFAVDASGKLGKDDIALATNIKIHRLEALSPEIAGNVEESGTVIGTLKDFALQAKLGGTIRSKGQASDPFNIDINVQHLPNLPAGTLAGSGKLENTPLQLDAAFARAADGALQVEISKSRWRSVALEADLHLAPGAKLPEGTAKFAVGRLQDFAPFVPQNLRGGASGDFAYTGGQNVKLNLNATNLVVTPSVGAINGKVTAAGPVQALGVKMQASIAGLMGSPAQLNFAGVLDVPGQKGQVSSLHASWRQQTAQLQGPVAIETKPAIAVRHLRLGLDSGVLALDGVVWPKLNVKTSLNGLPLAIANVFAPDLQAQGSITAEAALNGPPSAPNGTVQLHAVGLHIGQGAADALPPAEIAGGAQLAGSSANVNVQVKAGPDISLGLSGLAPFSTSGPMNLRAVGRVDLQLLNLLLAAGGTVVRGEVKSDLQLTGTPQSPSAAGSVILSGGSVENISSGLNLTQIGATVEAEGQSVALKNLTATAGHGTFTGEGTLGLDGEMPISLTLNADNASPVISDLITETLGGKITVNGAVKGPLTLAGNINIAKADINIPHGLPPSVANLTIINDGEKPPPPPAPPPPIALNLDVRAKNQIFVRGDGLFAELGGHVHLGGTLAALDPEGKFVLIRGSFALAGKSLQFTSGTIGFAGDGFIPVLDLEATVNNVQANNATLTVGGTAAKPVITLSSTPPMPSDEILAQLLFGQSASSLTPFQAASLAAALAQISGIGGGGMNPLDKVRNALGLDELSLGGSGTGPPSLQAGRYVAPGVYVGATQAANGQSTQVNVDVNLYKGLKLTTSTGTSSTGDDASSVGLTYQFNY